LKNNKQLLNQSRELALKPTDKMTTGRRQFILHSIAGAGALALAQQASAQAMVADNDPQATALGYVADAAKVDKAKQPKFAAGQNCGNCSLFQGKASDASGGCPLFAGKKVSSKGWCSAYSKKA
jgi:hypothetical protein